MRFGIIIPTFGGKQAWRSDDPKGPKYMASHERIRAAVNSIKKFTPPTSPSDTVDCFEYEILVSDDATPNFQFAGAQKAVCLELGVGYRRQAKWSYISGNFHAAGMELAPRCDVLVFFADDCLASQRWLEPIRFYYEKNPKAGMVSPVMIESWELAMNGLIPGEFEMYDAEAGGVVNGTVMREDLDYSKEIFGQAQESGAISMPEWCPCAGTDQEGKYNFNCPVPLDGGMGPCFSIRSDVWQEVGGMDRCEFSGDFECVLGFKVWDAGHTCVQVPCPPVYHGRGMSSCDLGATWDICRDEFTKYRPWWPLAVERWQQKWPTKHFRDSQQWYKTNHVYPATESVNRSPFMPHEEWKP